MIQYENLIEINQPRDLVFDFLALPSNWAKYLPTTIEVTPAINQNFNVGDQVTETLNVLGSKTYIEWTCKVNDGHSFYEIEGISDKHGGSKTTLSYEFFSDNGVTRVKRVIRHRFNSLRMRVFNSIWKLYFIYEAKGAFRRAKQLLELASGDCCNKET